MPASNTLSGSSVRRLKRRSEYVAWWGGVVVVVVVASVDCNEIHAGQTG